MSVLILMSSGGFTIKPNEQNKGNVEGLSRLI